MKTEKAEGKKCMVNSTQLNDTNKSKYSSNHNKYKKTKTHQLKDRFSHWIR